MLLQKRPINGDLPLPLDCRGASVGVLRMPSGASFPNHYHEHHEELFIAVSGAAELWIDQESGVILEPGDLAVCLRQEQHYLRTRGNELFVAYFIKTPNLPNDRVLVPWEPSA